MTVRALLPDGYERRGLSRLSYVACVFVVCGVLPALVHGMMVRMDEDELALRSDAIVAGEVEEIVRQDAAYRAAVIRVDRVVKGTIPLGGRIRFVFSPTVEDSPVFDEEHEYVLLYLRDTGGGSFQTVGGFQGKVSCPTREPKAQGCSPRSAVPACPR